jgi:hypothetical protein
MGVVQNSHGNEWQSEKSSKPDDGDVLRVFSETADDLSLVVKQYGTVVKVVLWESTSFFNHLDFAMQ